MVLLSGASLSMAQIDNAAGKILNSESKLTIGGYGQIDYNQDFGAEVKKIGKLDVHRLVMLFG